MWNLLRSVAIWHWKSPAGWWVKINHGSTWYLNSERSELPATGNHLNDQTWKPKDWIHGGFGCNKNSPLPCPFFGPLNLKRDFKMIVTNPILSNGFVLPWVVCHPGVVCQPKLQTTFGIGYSYPNQKNLPRQLIHFVLQKLRKNLKISMVPSMLLLRAW